MTSKEDLDRAELDDLRAITSVLRNFCEGKKTFKRAMVILTVKTELSEERITYIVKKYFKDGQYQ